MAEEIIIRNEYGRPEDIFYKIYQIFDCVLKLLQSENSQGRNIKIIIDYE